MADAALRHIASALARFCDGGRLVAIVGESFAPDNPAWRDAFGRLQERGRVVSSAAIDGAVYARHGTHTDTRLLVIDKLPAADPNVFPASSDMAGDVATLLDWVIQHVPSRLPIATPVAVNAIRRPAISRSAGASAPHASSGVAPEGVELIYETVEWSPREGARLTDALYEEYGLQSIRIHGTCAHPTKLVQSAAMASVAPPKPSYRPRLPSNLLADGVLSDAQLESIIYAGDAHSECLAGSWTVDATFDVVAAARDDDENAVRFRRGWFLGDGTGAGKGRQVAGILIDNWLKGRRRAVWISKSDELIEDAQRDWSALGMERLLVTPLSRFRQGTPVRLAEGVLFTTYATLRTDERGEKLSRVRQIVEWLGSDFDRRHHGPQPLLCPTPRSLGAAPTSRSPRAPSSSKRSRRVGSRRWRCWRAISRRSASTRLARSRTRVSRTSSSSTSQEQVRIYDAYADAFGIIHNNLDAAMRAANITGETGTRNGQAKSAARSAPSRAAKQRFFGHLLTSMKTPSLIRSIEHDLEAGHAAVIQIVSTGEALMERRLAEIPTEDGATSRSTSPRASMSSTISPIPFRFSSTSPSPTWSATSAPGLSIAMASRSRAGRPSPAAIVWSRNSPHYRRYPARWIRSSTASAPTWSPK
ncbi:hypothetical protein GGD66_002393 [Bradyrhizobium sp. CIR48]|nr:hypothetical protein [Bradyrhizobium sp. CIR48]